VTGRPLVLLHGLLVSGEMFEPVRDRWSARYRLVVPDLTRRGAPTLVLRGSADAAVPARHAELLAGGVPGARLRILDGAGHLLVWTHTGQFAEIVEDWLG
jgi:pimeloyl-ACP methyl ester carboxylesterase